MIFDDLISDSWVFNPNTASTLAEVLRELAVFRVDEDFIEDNASSDATVPSLASPLPYPEMAICFRRTVLVLFSNHVKGEPFPRAIHSIRFVSRLQEFPIGHLLESAATRCGVDLARARELCGVSEGEVIRGVQGHSRLWFPTISVAKTVVYDPNGFPLGIDDRQDFHDGPYIVQPHTMDVSLLDHLLISKLTTFLSCKNVRARDVHPEQALQKARIARGKLPLVSFKVLELQPTEKATAGGAKHLWTNRVHLCRGHPKEFTSASKLFGKHIGRYWWAPYARGSASAGTVNKHYSIKKKKPRGPTFH